MCWLVFRLSRALCCGFTRKSDELGALRAQVEDLEQQEWVLSLELERERSPERLAARAHALGMVPAAPIGLPASSTGVSQ